MIVIGRSLALHLRVMYLSEKRQLLSKDAAFTLGILFIHSKLLCEVK